MSYQLGIYTDFPKKWNDVIGRIKNKLEQPSENTTEPHLSLYVCGLKSIKDFDNLCHDLQTNLNPKPFKLSIGKVKEKNHFYYADVKPHKILHKIHRQVLKIATIHRRGLIRPKDIERLKTDHYSPKQAEYCNKYGYARVFDLFEPHITLGDLKTSKTKIDIALLQEQISKIKQKTFQVNNIIVAIFEETSWKRLVKETKIQLI